MNNGLNTKKKGNLGEDIACVFLSRNGFRVIDRNYRKKCGEIDIIAIKSVESAQNIHFIEVKSVSGKYLSGRDVHRPEDNVHPLKVARLRRIIQSYMAERRLSDGVIDGSLSFCVHIVTVRMDFECRRAQVEMIENVIL